MPNFQEMPDLPSSKDERVVKEKEKQKDVKETDKQKDVKETDKQKDVNETDKQKDVKESDKHKEERKSEVRHSLGVKKELKELKEKAEIQLGFKKRKSDIKDDEHKEKEKDKEPEKSKSKLSKTGPLIKEIKNEKDFEAKLKNAGDELVIVDFYATWCMPCKMASPQVERLAEQYKDVVFLKIDIDENEALTTKYDVSTLPTFLYFKHGKLVETVIGSNVDRVEENLKKHKAKKSSVAAQKA